MLINNDSTKPILGNKNGKIRKNGKVPTTYQKV